MPQPRKYSTAAEKQAAYRARHLDKPPREALLAALARTLHSTITGAAHSGEAQAQAVAGDRADETLQKLIEYFRSAGTARDN
jgi:hypothetical protein